MGRKQKSKQSTPASNQKVAVSLAPFWKRLFAWVYDLLGGMAVFVLAMVVGLLLLYLVTWPFVESFETVSLWLSKNPVWGIYIFLSIQYYYCWCWVKGGQTLGMRAWRLKVCYPDGQLLTWKAAYIRSLASLAGLGTIWCLVDKEKRGLQDLACGSLVVVMPKDYERPQKPLI